MPHPTSTGLALSISDQFTAIRALSVHLCETLGPEDMVIQSMTDCSPTRWHLAHTTWFFETFVLCRFSRSYKVYDERYPFLFNSYYVQAGARFDRPKRGLLSRPTVREVLEYRAHVDAAMAAFMSQAPADPDPAMLSTLEIGLNHEQQHQELLLTDIKHMLSLNPLHPVFREAEIPVGDSVAHSWVSFQAGVRRIGHEGGDFSYDNEGPAHRVFLESFELSNRLATNGEFLEFVEDGGYQNPLYWLVEGSGRVAAEEWSHPLYWERHDDGWHEFTLSGLRELDPNRPVCHISMYEADAYARWKGCRLPTEFEWEIAAAQLPIQGNFADQGVTHPIAAASSGEELLQMFGDAWEWTGSSYGPYPGYRAVEGALGEYNGKFMCNQYVLRGGSCATSRDHMRKTYRNFFPAYARWQFSGVRLARTTN